MSILTLVVIRLPSGRDHTDSHPGEAGSGVRMVVHIRPLRVGVDNPAVVAGSPAAGVGRRAG